MATVRESPGIAYLQVGDTFGTLAVERMVASKPEPRYAIRCQVCRTATTESHSRLRNGSAKCRFSGCGKAPKRRDILEDERRKAVERAERRRQEDLAASERRMMSDSDGWERPTKYAPAPSKYTSMSERERLSLREHREAEEAEARAAREARERPIKEAEVQLRETHRKIAALERERFTDPKMIDVDFWVDPEAQGFEHLSVEGKIEVNIHAFNEFADRHPELVANDYNFKLLGDYFKKHEVTVVTPAMIESVYKRMVACGIQFDAPEPETSDILPNGMPDYSKRSQANLTIAPSREPERPKASMFEGFDLETGAPRTYSEREIDRMSSEQMKRALQMTVRGTLGLPNIGPGPGGPRL